jgi:hypothetical protein
VVTRTLARGHVRRGLALALGTLLAVAGVPAARALSTDATSTTKQSATKSLFADFVPPMPGDLVIKQPDGSSFKGALTAAEIGANIEVASASTVVPRT